MLAAVLALLASLSWGTSDFLAGVESRRSTAWTAALAGQAVASLSLIALLVVLAPARPALSAFVAPALGGFVGGFGVLTAYRAFTLADLSLVSPIIAGAALVPVLWGVAAGERPGALQAIGIVLTLAGIVTISSGGRTDSISGRASARTGILMAIVSAIAMGLFLVALSYAGRAEPLYTVTVARAAAVLTILAAVAVLRPPIRPRRRAIGTLLAIGLLIAVANLLFTWATTFGYLSVVGVLGWLNPAVTMVWAAVLLRERLRPFQLAAAASVFAGIVSLTLG